VSACDGDNGFGGLIFLRVRAWNRKITLLRGGTGAVKKAPPCMNRDLSLAWHEDWLVCGDMTR